MKCDNVVREKSFAFAVRVVRAYQHLVGEKKEFVLSKQFLRSGTSIGANVEESIGGQSDADFISKMSIAYKEARETVYWIRLLQATDYLTDNQAQSLLADAEELCRIIGKIQITTKHNRNSQFVIRNSPEPSALIVSFFSPFPLTFDDTSAGRPVSARMTAVESGYRQFPLSPFSGLQPSGRLRARRLFCRERPI